MELRRRPLHSNGRFHPDGALSRRRSLLLLLIVFGWLTPARAQVSVEVSPLRVEIQAGPGATSTQAVTLTNGGTETIRVRARISDWDLARDGSPQFEGVPEGGPFSAAAWVRVAPPELLIDPGKDGIIRFSLTVPPETAPAGYRAGILFEFVPPSGEAAARKGMQFRSRVATLIYANVGEPPAAVELTDLSQRVTADRTQLIAVLANTGKRTVRTKGTMTLYDAGGKPLQQIPIPDVPVLPQSEREVAIVAFEAAKPLAPGEYRVEVKIDVGMPALLVGETTIKVAR
jgi:P pilus assembly chaperone PapD